MDMRQSTFKRIILITTKKIAYRKMLNLGLDVFEKHCYTRISREEQVQDNLQKIQQAGIYCKILVIDESQFAAGNGVIAENAILPKA